LQTAEAIYRTKYTTACDFDNLGPGKDCVVFDFGVNSGPSTAVKFAQMVVGVSVDGVLGPITERAINDCDPVEFIEGLCAKRMAFLESLPTWPTFKGGWSARVTDLKAYSLALATPKPMALVSAPLSEKLTRIPNASAKAYAIAA